MNPDCRGLERRIERHNLQVPAKMVRGYDPFPTRTEYHPIVPGWGRMLTLGPDFMPIMMVLISQGATIGTVDGDGP